MASKTEQEPSIEEILASIRQIISDDDAPRDSDLDLSQGPDESFAIPVAQPEPPPPSREAFDDVLDLTNAVEESEADFEDDFSDDEPEDVPQFTIPAEPAPVAAPQVAPPSPPQAPPPQAAPSQTAHNGAGAETLFSGMAAEATSNAFSRLMGNMPVERAENRVNYAGAITLEDIARDLLKPMLREWIDRNVPALVERLVEKELEKLSRRARDD
jgi:uncharacterized protein